MRVLVPVCQSFKDVSNAPNHFVEGLLVVAPEDVLVIPNVFEVVTHNPKEIGKVNWCL